MQLDDEAVRSDDWTYGSKGKMMTAIGIEKPVKVVIAKTNKGDDPNCTLEDIYPEIGPEAAGSTPSITSSIVS